MTIKLESALSSLLHVPVGHIGLIYKTFRFSRIKIWNYVEVNVPINISFTCFKNAIKCHLLGNNVNNLYKSVKFPIDKKCPYIIFTVSNISVN